MGGWRAMAEPLELRPGAILRDLRDHPDSKLGQMRYVVIGPTLLGMWLLTYARTGGIVSAVPEAFLQEHFEETGLD